ncbi:MAG: ROK family protein [Bacteroidales bacterium]|nr:ROK family protein [Bacteroidales bacterium]
MNKIAIGVDIGGTNTKIGLVDRNGELKNSTSILTQEGNTTFDDFLASLKVTLDQMISSMPMDVEIIGMGIGAPNANYYKGTIENAANLKWKGIIKVLKALNKYYTFPTVLTNDANAAAIGEMVFGGAKEMNDFLLVTLGTGLGSGFVANGKLIYGHDGFAGELGHINVIPDGRLCGCGRKGCLETYASATGVHRTVTELLKNTKEKSLLQGIKEDDITSKMVYEAAVKGDKIALKAFDYTAQMLGKGLADAVAITSPEAIFLFGGLVKAGKYILAPTKKYFEKSVMNNFQNKVKILPSELLDKNVAVLGAAALAWKEFGG